MSGTSSELMIGGWQNLLIFAQAYGSDAYSSNDYNQTESAPSSSTGTYTPPSTSATDGSDQVSEETPVTDTTTSSGDSGSTNEYLRSQPAQVATTVTPDPGSISPALTWIPIAAVVVLTAVVLLIIRRRRHSRSQDYTPFVPKW